MDASKLTNDAKGKNICYEGHIMYFYVSFLKYGDKIYIVSLSDFVTLPLWTGWSPGCPIIYYPTLGKVYKDIWWVKSDSD